MMTDKGDSNRTVKALTRRIGLSVLLIVLVIVGILTGIIRPHGIGQIATCFRRESDQSTCLSDITPEEAASSAARYLSAPSSDDEARHIKPTGAFLPEGHKIFYFEQDVIAVLQRSVMGYLSRVPCHANCNRSDDLPSKHVDEHEQAQPDHVDEVPVPGDGLEREVVLRREVALEAAQPDHRQHDRADASRAGRGSRSA